MNLKRFFREKGVVLGGAILTTVCGLVLCMDQLSQWISFASYDLLSSIKPLVHNPGPVAMVYMDEQSFKALGQDYDKGTWDRRLHTKLLHRLKDYGVKGVAFDIVFSIDSPDPSVDIEFSRAITNLGNVVLAAEWTKPDPKLKSAIVNPPNDRLAEAAAALGIAEMGPEEDLMVRRHFSDPNTTVPTLAWASAEMIGVKLPATHEEKVGDRWINYYGPPDHLNSVSYHRVLSDDPTNSVSADLFKDKFVFVGANIRTVAATQRKDEYRNPYSRWISQGASIYMPGMDVQATVFLNLLRRDWISRLIPTQEHSIVLIAGLLLGAGLSLVRPWLAFILGGAAMVITSVASYYAFTKANVWWAWLIVVLVQIPIALIWSIVVNSIILFVGKRLMEQSVAMYVSPAQVKKIAQNPDLMKPGNADKAELSILFSDIANFTNISEGLDSKELATFMNKYFEAAVSECVHPVNGTVIKFIGDAIFAIWNAPELQPNHRELACRGALLLRDRLKADEFTLRRGDYVTRTRIGLHTGVAVVGNFGSSTRVDYTAFGENINLAARMEGLNKYLGTDSLVTGDTYEPVQEKFVARFAGLFQLKGFAKAVKVYELVGLPENAAESAEWRATYAQALNRFSERDFEGAKALFQKTIELHPNDGPSLFLLKHIKDMDLSDLDPDWHGEVELKEK